MHATYPVSFPPAAGVQHALLAWAEQAERLQYQHATSERTSWPVTMQDMF
jgi:hypothetical protein